ncbi:hypothetical protein B9Z42_16050 [Limnohabitans sp. B9-3]|nr:hypothetical protein B9Z42_16050 [Limnohabitans sp. B9-3]
MSDRATIIFGNGLGMALDPDYFQLKSALYSVWNDSDLLSKDQKKLIQTALPGTSDEVYPESEDQLNELQVAIFASELLKAYETEEAPWLNENSREIVAAFKKFIHQTSHYFHRSGKQLPDGFLDPLVEFIKTSKSHVALLNYDNLLYDPLLRTKVMDGYSGTLIDGFLDEFSPKNLDRYGTKQTNLSWFLHLHGSPLFVGNKKCGGASRDFLEAEEECHVVLTHVTHKPSVIQTSDILSEYWKRFDRALSESESIIVFGYSGLDTHLNEVIAKHGHKDIAVIEWEGSGNYEERLNFWKISFDDAPSLTLIQKKNILEFNYWATVIPPPF